MSRQEIVPQLLDLYKDENIVNGRLHVIFEGEEGIDAGGLSRELFTLFWGRVTRELFTGEHCVIPVLPVHKRRNHSWKFVSLGRILTHTVALTGTIPANLSLSLLAAVAETHLTNDMVLEDFLLHVTDSESALLRKAMQSFDKLNDNEKDRLLQFFTSHKFNAMPNQNPVREQILDIADEELFRKPAAPVEQMKMGIPDSHMKIFWNNLSGEDIRDLLQEQRPTAGKVLEVMTTDPEYLTDQESTTFYYLQEFIRGLAQDVLQDFLLFCTGSVHQPRQLGVTFTDLIGAERRPIAHTCSNALEIPRTYDSLQEFRREFMHLLQSPEAWQYSDA